MTDKGSVEKYTSQMSTQMRKGFIAYCVLKVCSKKLVYTSDIIKELRDAKLVVVEGTIYPLLSHEWQESEQGPPRKYYKITEFGEEVMKAVREDIQNLNNTIKKL